MRIALMTSAALLVAGCTDAPPSAAGKALPEVEVTAEVRLPETQSFELDNGLRVLLVERPGIPLVAFSAQVAGGSIADPAGLEGAGALLAELLQKGAGTRDAEAFAEAVDGVGGILSVQSGRDSFVVSGEFLSEHADLMLELAADLLQRPKLDRTEFTKLREREMQQLQADKDSDPGALMGRYASAWLFGDHPYARPASGDETSLARIGHGDISTYYRRWFGADRTVIAVVGAFDATAMREAISARFGGWRRAEGTLPEVAAPVAVSGRRVLLVDKPDATQTYFWIGNTGVDFDDPDRAAIDLVNTVFGGRFTSMLNTALRVETGLTYGARSQLFRGREGGSVGIYSFTATGTTEQAMDLALGVLGRLHADGLDAATLTSARAYVLGQFPPDYETSRQIARELAWLARYGLGHGYVNDYGAAVSAVDLAATRAVIDRVYPTAENLSLVMIGNADAVRGVAAKYGEVTEMKITDAKFRP